MEQEKVGKFIAELRRERGMTQEKLGERLGVTNKTVSRWETGRYMPDVDKLLELAGLLGVSVNELLSGERLKDRETLIKKADENLTEALRGSGAFGLAVIMEQVPVGADDPIGPCTDMLAFPINGMSPLLAVGAAALVGPSPVHIRPLDERYSHPYSH